MRRATRFPRLGPSGVKKSKRRRPGAASLGAGAAGCARPLPSEAVEGGAERWSRSLGTAREPQLAGACTALKLFAET